MYHRLLKRQVNFLRKGMEVILADVADIREEYTLKWLFCGGGIIQNKYLIWGSTFIMTLILG